MNREQRRLLDKKKPVVNTYEKQLQDAINAHIDKQIYNVIMGTQRIVLNAVCISLADEFDFTPEQLDRLVSKVNNQFDCVLADTVSLKDFEEICKGEGLYDAERHRNGKQTSNV